MAWTVLCGLERTIPQELRAEGSLEKGRDHEPKEMFAFVLQFTLKDGGKRDYLFAEQNGSESWERNAGEPHAYSANDRNAEECRRRQGLQELRVGHGVGSQV